MNLPEFVTRYLDGETCQNLAIEYGVASSTMRRWLVNNGIDIRGRYSPRTIPEGVSRHFFIKQECLNHYGNRCVCCGQTDIRYLTIDHINNDGKQHRETFSGPIYDWLRSHSYPEGFQILCSNCNYAKAYFGGCEQPCQSRVCPI